VGLVCLGVFAVIFLWLLTGFALVFLGLVLSLANAWAEPSSILGVVKDATGQPIKGADIRIETRNGERLI